MLVALAVLALAVIAVGSLHLVTASCAEITAGAAANGPEPAAGLEQAAGVAPGAGAAPAAPAAPADGPASAEALYYNPQAGVDSCSLEPLAAGGWYVSVPAGQYQAGAACGAYLDITGPHGSIQAEIVDHCPGCAASQLDLSSTAFARIQPLASGTAAVSYQLARDPQLSGPVAVRVGPGSGLGSLTIQVVNHGNPLARVQVATQQDTARDGSAQHGPWTSLAPRADGYWVAASGVGAGPFDVRITDALGNQAVLTRIRLSPGALQRTSVWLYRHTAPTSPSPSPSATPSPSPTPSPGPAVTPQAATRPTSSC
jgi:expansin (peptidoglycan-binding protein)